MKKTSTIPTINPIPKSVFDDYRWADAHHSELSKKYPEQWIAIVNKKVIKHGKRPERVRADAHRCVKRSEIALHFVEGRLHLY